MQLNHIQSGTAMTILCENDGNKKLRASFVDNYNDSIFYLYCQDVLGRFDHYVGRTVTIEFSIAERLFKASGRVVGKGGNRKGSDTVEFELVSKFEELMRRKYDRYDFQVLTNIFNYSDLSENENRGSFICDSVSVDISEGGISLHASRRLEKNDSGLYTLEFCIKPGSLFSIYTLPAKLVRVSRTVSVFSSAFYYGFEFDFSNRPGLQSRLFNDLFELKLRSSFGSITNRKAHRKPSTKH